jgi:ABC-type uncharacterized transport system ATPase subunit
MLKQLYLSSRLLILDEPTKVNGRPFQPTRRSFARARNRGVAVLLFSEGLDELLALSDRLLVMSAGRIVYETAADSVDIATLGRHMASH